MNLSEHVDLNATYRRGVRLGYTPDVLTDAGRCRYSTQHKLWLIYPLAVADTSVMLALMAGRNAGAGVTLVKEGKVCRVDSA